MDTVKSWLRSLQLEEHGEALEAAGVTSMVKAIKLADEDLLSLGVTSPSHRRALLESIANINSLNQDSGETAYQTRDTRDPKMMRGAQAVVSRLFRPKKTRQFRVVIDRVTKVRNEPLSLAFRRHCKTLARQDVVQRAFFPPSIDTLSEHKDSDKVVTEDMLLSGGLRVMERQGVVGSGIYFPSSLNVYDADDRVLRVIVCDVALGESAVYDSSVDLDPPALGPGRLDSVTLARPVPSKINSAMKDDLVIRLPQQAVPRYVVAFRVYAANITHQIRVVSADGSGDHRGVAEAIDAADSGDLIVLRPGTYTESLTIDADVHIIAGGDGSALLDGCIVISSSCQLTGVWVEPSSPPADGAAITVQRGSPTLTKCDVHGMVSVQADAQLVFRESRVHHSSSHGVLVGPRATCLVEQSVVEEVELCGIQVEGGARGIIMNSSVSACKQNGIYLLDGAKGVIEGCNIFSNAFPGIAVNCADPVIARNRVHHNERSGIVIAGKSEGNTLVEENNVFENGRDGIMVAKDAVCLLQANAMFENKGSGMQIMTGGMPTVSKCRIFSNHDTGVLVAKGGQGTVESCQIFGNSKCGLSISRSGTETFVLRNCDVFSNGSTGVEILQGAAPKLIHNRVYEHEQNVSMSKKAAPELEKNELFKGNVCALFVHAEAEPVLRANIIHSNTANIAGRTLDLEAENEML